MPKSAEEDVPRHRVSEREREREREGGHKFKRGKSRRISRAAGSTE